MELRDLVIDTVGSVAARVGIGEVKKYYPLLFQVVEQDERTTWYLDDIRAWADGDLGGIVGMERQVIVGLAQAVLNYTAQVEAENPPPEGMRRIERREDEDGNAV